MTSEDILENTETRKTIKTFKNANLEKNFVYQMTNFKTLSFVKQNGFPLFLF